MAYHEVTPTDELTAEVQYLDGNTDAPTDVDIQLRYLDGNTQVFTSHKEHLKMSSHYSITKKRFTKGYIPSVSALNPVINITTGEQENLRMYMDGNKEFYTPTDYRWHSGESCDGNLPAVPVVLFNGELQWHDNVKCTVIGSSLYDWYKEKDLLVLKGPIIFTKNKKEELIIKSESYFNKTVENRRGIKQPDVQVHVDDGYDSYISKLPLTKISGQLNEAYRYSGSNTYTYAPGEDLLVVASPYDDGTGQVYDEDGIVIGRTRDYGSIFYDPYSKKDLMVERVPKWTETLYTAPTPDNFVLNGELPYPYEKDLENNATFFAIIPLHSGRQKLSVETEEFVSIYYRSSSISRGIFLTHGYDFSYYNSRFVVDPNGTYALNPGVITIDAIEGSEVLIDTRKRTGKIRVNLTSSYDSGYDYINIAIPKYYLFDYGIMKDIPRTESNLVQLDHTEYRLKGPVYFPNEGVAKWCVLEYQKPKIYKVVKTVEILDFKKLVNQDIFVSIRTNPNKVL